MRQIVLISCVGVIALAQAPVRHNDVRIAALAQHREGNVIHLDGAVTIEAEGFTLRADKAEFSSNTGEIVAHGDVRVKLK